MPSDNHPNPGQPIPQTVHVALYEHRYGTDVRAFLDSEEAMHWRTEIAKEWWTDAFDDDLPPDDQIGDVYFEEARLVIECRKLYAQDLDPSAFLAQTLVDIYPEKDYHRLYIGEIAKVLAK